jgi:hypothetical protein
LSFAQLNDIAGPGDKLCQFPASASRLPGGVDLSPSWARMRLRFSWCCQVS